MFRMLKQVKTLFSSIQTPWTNIFRPLSRILKPHPLGCNPPRRNKPFCPSHPISFFRGYKFALPIFQQKNNRHIREKHSLSGIWHLFFFFFSFSSLDLHFLELTYPLPAGTFERMIFPTSLWVGYVFSFPWRVNLNSGQIIYNISST